MFIDENKHDHSTGRHLVSKGEGLWAMGWMIRIISVFLPPLQIHLPLVMLATVAFDTTAASPSVPNLFWILQWFRIPFVALPRCNNTKALSAEKIPHWNVRFVHNHTSARILSSGLLHLSPSSLLSQHVQKTCRLVSLLCCAIESTQFEKRESSQ